MNNLAFIGNLAGPDGILILFLVLIFFGAKRLPELARSMGLAVREFNKAKEELTSQFTNAMMEPPMAAPRSEALPVVKNEPVTSAEKPKSSEV